MDPDSTTETYAACTLEINSRRWAGVPFYLRTGKRLGRRVTEIALVFKDAPHHPFPEGTRHAQGPNVVVIRVQPDEGVLMRFGSKVPGSAMEVRDVNMDFGYSGGVLRRSPPEAYEAVGFWMRCWMRPACSPRMKEVELSWKILDPVLEYWAKHGKPEDYVLVRGVRSRRIRCWSVRVGRGGGHKGFLVKEL